MGRVIPRAIAAAAGVAFALGASTGVAADDRLTDPRGDVTYEGSDLVAATISIGADHKMTIRLDMVAEPIPHPDAGEVGVTVGLEPRNQSPTTNPAVCGTYSDELGGQMPRVAEVTLPYPDPDLGVVANVDGTRVTIVLPPEYVRDTRWIGVHLEVWVYNELPDWVPDWPREATLYGGCHFMEVPAGTAMPPTDTAQSRMLHTPTSTPSVVVLAGAAMLGVVAGFRLGPRQRRGHASRSSGPGGGQPD